MAVNKIEYVGKVLIDLTEDTVVTAGMLDGMTAHDKTGVKVIGTMPNNGAVIGTISQAGDSYAIPKGFHNGNGKVSIAESELSKLIAENIKKGVTILGVTGTYDGSTVGPVEEDHTELGSITLDGSCYFDTEIYPNQDTNTEIKWYVQNGTNYIFGARDDKYKYGYTVTDNFYAVRGTVSSAAQASVFWSTDWLVKQIGTKFEFNSNAVNTAAIASFTLTSPCYIGNMSKNKATAGLGLKGKIYYAKIYSGSKLVADMIPVKKSDGTLCLWDKIRKKYIYKSGTGSVTE